MYNILVPADGSANALLAVNQAARVAAGRGDVHVHLLNVQPRLNRHAGRFLSRQCVAAARAGYGRASLAAAERLLLEAGVPFSAQIETGDAAAIIARACRLLEIDQVIVGSSRKSALLRLLEGSLTTRLLECATVPVTVVAGRRPLAIERFGLPAGVGLGVAALLLAAD